MARLGRLVFWFVGMGWLGVRGVFASGVFLSLRRRSPGDLEFRLSL